MKYTAILLVLLVGCSVRTQTVQEPVREGVWGGPGIELTVTARGAKVDYGCDSGTIDEPLRTDSHGKIFARGTHVFGRGGPRNPGDPAAKPHLAKYEGVRNGDTLKLTVLLPELNRKLGEFNLQLGGRPVLERCG